MAEGEIEPTLVYLDDASLQDLNLVECLEKLRRRLDASRSRQYVYFYAARGKDCGFALRSLEKFEQYDLPDLKKMILHIAKLLEKIDG